METVIDYSPFIILIISVGHLLIVRKYVQVKKNVKFIEETTAKAMYPDLSDVDMNYRRGAIANYQRFYFKENARKKKLKLLASFGIIIVFGSLIGCLASENLIGSSLCLTILFFLLSLFYSGTPNSKKEHIFWRNYLDEHPDNPLMVVLLPEEEGSRFDKESMKMAVYSFISGIILLGLTVLLSYYMTFYPYM